MHKIIKSLKSLYARFKLILLTLFTNRRGVIIDCGANIGKYTTFFARYNRTVYAFEPNPFAFKVLSSKFINNQSIHCINKAVSLFTGKTPLYLHTNTNEDSVKWSVASSIFLDKGNVSKENRLEVDSIDFSQFIRSLGGDIFILKMDIEGAEYDILLDLIDKGVTKNIKYIFVETHVNRIKSLEGKHAKLVSKIKEHNISNINLDWE
jgi:FkbM family methyltransferase